ncbi:MAG: hypothetical protein PUG74_06720 [Prevotellaceae bacterium]|nr:hypothetical protein [Prevotellaceae bacterium]
MPWSEINGKRVWQPDAAFNPNEGIKSPAPAVKTQLQNQTEAVAGNMGSVESDGQKNQRIIDHANGLQSQNVERAAAKAMENGIKPASADAVDDDPEREEKMADADYRNISAINKASADAYWKASKASGLGEQMKLLKRYDETHEQRDERERKERRNRNLTSAFNMLGALGNFAVAATSRDGRSVPVANVIEAADNGMEKERSDREKAIARLSDLRRRQSELILNGYADAQNRKRQAEVDAANQAYKQDQLDVQRAANDRLAKKDEYSAEQWKADYELQKYKAETDRMKTKADASKSYAMAERYRNGGFGGKSKTFVTFLADDGNTAIDIPKERYDSTISGAFGKLDSQHQDDALSMIIRSKNPRLSESTAMQQVALMTKEQKDSYIKANTKDLHMALQACADELWARDAVEYIRNAVKADDRGLQREDIEGITPDENGDGESEDERETIENF